VSGYLTALAIVAGGAVGFVFGLLAARVNAVPDPEVTGIYVCPECGRVASVPAWVERPICVHAWDGASPEIWDGGGDERPEDAVNEKYRTPGPDTWADMVPVVGATRYGVAP
jgi:hypothetical protein